MPLMQLIYCSRPFGFSERALGDILATARLNNRRDGITGLLLCRSDLYVQMLEGPRERVTRCFSRISLDDRHVDVTLIWAGDALARLFPDWEMRDDPARSWMWTRAAVRAGEAREAGVAAYRSLFARMAEEPKLELAW